MACLQVCLLAQVYPTELRREKELEPEFPLALAGPLALVGPLALAYPPALAYPLVGQRKLADPQEPVCLQALAL